MDDRTMMGDDSADKRGCLRAALAAPVLVLLAPFVVAIRWFSRLRRGHGTELAQEVETIDVADGGVLLRAHFEIDVPQESGIVRSLTMQVVRLAESLADGDENYHLLRDEPGADESVVVSIGPSVQLLAERFMLTLQRTALEHRTVVWLALPRSVALGELVDPTSYSPQTEGEPDRLIQGAPLRWALVMRWRRSLASIRYDIEVLVPENASEQLEAFSRRLGGLTHP